jgi:hypothetical protein
MQGLIISETELELAIKRSCIVTDAWNEVGLGKSLRSEPAGAL